MRNTSGFTLIELVFVIVILAILAALALPRYVDLQVSARQAKVQAAYGAIRSAAALAKAQCVVGSNLGTGGCTGAAGANVSVTIEGAVIPMAYSYPAATGIQEAAGILSSEYTVGVAGDSVTVSVPGAATSANCAVTYGQPTGPGLAPVVSVLASDC